MSYRLFIESINPVYQQLVNLLNDKLGDGHKLEKSPTSSDGFVIKRNKFISFHIDSNDMIYTNGSGNRRGMGKGSVKDMIKKLESN